MLTQYERTVTCTKYLARLATLCNSVSALCIVMRSTEVKNVDAIIKYNSELITKLQDVQRALLYFKNTPPDSGDVPPTPGPQA